MFRWLWNLFFGDTKKKIQEIANRVERFKQRYAQANDIIKYNISNTYYNLLLNANTLEEAKHYEQEFYKKIEEQGTDLKNYKQSKDYATDSTIQDFDSSNTTSTTIEDTAIIYYSSQNSQTASDNSTTEGQGEFGGGGASASWEETNSDNS